MEGFSPLTVEEWEALVAVMPTGSAEADVQAREKLFKELVVRADACPSNRVKSKGSGSNFKGTLKLSDIEGPLECVLRRQGVSNRSIEAVVAVHARAFLAAKKWVTGISVMDDESCDMNQFHALVMYITCYLSLWNSLLQTGSPSLSRGGNVEVDEQSFQGLLTVLMSPAKVTSGVPTAAMKLLSSWNADPQVAFSGLDNGNGFVAFDQLAERCICAAVDAKESGNEDCRKRAFQLLQALNNVPSLPNAVPGLKASDWNTEKEQDDAPMARQMTSQWATTNRSTFREFTPREPQGLHAPSHRDTCRDLQWRVFPVEPNTSAKTRLAMT